MRSLGAHAMLPGTFPCTPGTFTLRTLKRSVKRPCELTLEERPSLRNLPPLRPFA